MSREENLVRMSSRASRSNLAACEEHSLMNKNSAHFAREVAPEDAT